MGTGSGMALCVAVALGGVAAAETPRTPAEVDFITQIRPIFEANCFECHGPEKQKGKMRLDLRASVFVDDEDDWVIVPGDAEASLLLELISLPADDLDVMPAEGDPLTREQIDLIRAWINEGADWPAEADAIETARTPSPQRIELRELTEAEQLAETKALDAVRSSGALALRLAANTSALDVNFSLLGDKVVDRDLTLLAGLEPTLAWLNLGRTRVTDTGLARLAKFKELRRLNLSRTKIGDAGLKGLADLEHLEYLNLYGSEVTDAGLEHLAGLKSLRKLYVWQSKVTDEGIANLAARLPDLTIVGAQPLALAVEESAEAEMEAEVETEAEEPALPACCASAEADGHACEHECCVEAAKQGQICEKCAG